MTREFLQAALRERMALLDRVRDAFRTLYPEPPKRLPRGPVQNALLDFLEMSGDGGSRRLINEALEELGYDKVRIRGRHFYRGRQ